MSDPGKPPDRIWLQFIGADKSDLTKEGLFQRAPEITWCQDKIFDTDIEYVRVKRGDQHIARVFKPETSTNHLWAGPRTGHARRNRDVENKVADVWRKGGQIDQRSIDPGMSPSWSCASLWDHSRP